MSYISHLIRKRNSTRITDFNVQHKIVKHLDQRKGGNLWDVGLGQALSVMKPRAQSIKKKKKDKLAFFKIKKLSLC